MVRHGPKACLINIINRTLRLKVFFWVVLWNIKHDSKKNKYLSFSVRLDQIVQILQYQIKIGEVLCKGLRNSSYVVMEPIIYGYSVKN